MKSVVKSVPALKTWVWLGALAGIAFSSIVFAPASWLASGLASASSGRVLLQEPRGTVWAGSGELILAGGNGAVGAVRLPSRLNWMVSIYGLGLTLLLDSPCCTQTPAQIDLAFEGGKVAWVLHNVRLTLPAELLTGFGAPWNTLQLAGNLTLNSDYFAGRWSAKAGLESMTGHAMLQADNIATALSTVRPLGSYRMTTTGATLRLETTLNDAALQLTGTGQVENGRARFQGEALAAVGREQALSNLLHIIGQWQSSADGRARSLLKLGI